MRKSRKTVAEAVTTPGRVLARTLAAELRSVKGTGDPVEVTDPGPNGRKDITMASADVAEV